MGEVQSEEPVEKSENIFILFRKGEFEIFYIKIARLRFLENSLRELGHKEIVKINIKYHRKQKRTLLKKFFDSRL